MQAVHTPGLVHDWQLASHTGKQKPATRAYPALHTEHDVPELHVPQLAEQTEQEPDEA